MYNSSQNFRMAEVKISLDNSHMFYHWYYKAVTMKIILTFLLPKCFELSVLLQTPEEYTRLIFLWTVSSTNTKI